MLQWLYLDAEADRHSRIGPGVDPGEVKVTEENMQARIRGVILMALSNKFGHILLNTSNKSEAAVGYGTLYGDMSGGLAVVSRPEACDYAGLCEMICPRQAIRRPFEIVDARPAAETEAREDT